MPQLQCKICGEFNDLNVTQCIRCGNPLSSATGNLIIDPLPDQFRLPQMSWLSRIRTTPWLIRIGGLLSALLLSALILSLVFILLPPGLPSLPQGMGTVKFPNGQYVGVNDGSSFPLDTERQDPQNLRQMAMKALQKGGSDSGVAIPEWNQYLSGQNENDAEIKIYLENQYISKQKYVTLILGLDFPVHSPGSPDADTATRSALQGAYIAQEEFNKQHDDIKLRLLLANTGDDNSYVVPLAQQIARITRDDKTVIGILGWQTSVRTDGMLNALQQNGINMPMLSQTASSDYLSKEARINFFRIAPLDKAQAQAALSLTKMLQATQAIVFIDPSDPFSQNLGQDFEQKFPHTYKEVHFTIEKTNTATFSALLKDALQGVSDTSHLVVFFTGTTNYDVSQFQETLNSYPSFSVIAGDSGYIVHKASYDRWYIVAYGFHDEWQTLMGSSNAFFGDYSAAFNSDNNPQNAGAYGYGLPDAVAIISYDGAKVLARGIEIALSQGAANPTQQDLQNALSSITDAQPWQGVSGRIAFDSQHDAVNKALIILHVDSDGHLKMFCRQGVFASNVSSGFGVRQCDG